MGKGIAKAFRERYPEMFQEYKKLCTNKELNIGDLWLWKGKDQWVLNFPTKKHWRNPSKVEYIEIGLKSFVQQYEKLGIREISFPRLGCGNGGLDWKIVQSMMRQYLANLPINIYIHDYQKDIGKLEHEEGFFEAEFTGNYEDFLRDIYSALYQHKGQVNSLKFGESFSVRLDDEKSLILEGKSSKIIAHEEDLYRIWQILKRFPLIREDLPEAPYQNAFALFSVLSSLPYVRPVQIVSQKGKPSLALELKQRHTNENVSNPKAPKQGELSWG